MRIFENRIYQDGGPNDRGFVVGYKLVLKGKKIPVSKNGFEEWHEISKEEYTKRKNKAYEQYKLFILF